MIGGGAIGWWAWNKFGGMVEVSSANRWMPIIALLILAGSQWIGALRYQTQQIICPNFHGSYSKHPINYKGFYIFAIDSFNAGGISWDFANRILVLREETVQFYPRGAVSIAQPKQVLVQELGDEIELLIKDDKFLKKASREVYYGWFDDLNEVDYDFEQLKELAGKKENPNHIYNLLKEELDVDNPKVSTLLWLYRNENKARSKQTEQFDSTVENLEKGGEHTKAMKDIYSEKKDKTPKDYQGYEES